MRVVMFCHSLVSDWNHGNAHFLRGIVSELQRRGHEVQVLEPADGWSRSRLLAEHGPAAIDAFHHAYPHLTSRDYDPTTLDLDSLLDGVDLAIVHEWTDTDLVRRLGEARGRHHNLRLLFHDTHHRSVSDHSWLAAGDLRHYDGVLAFGRVISARYVSEGWARRAWTWHEAADTQVFRPRQPREPEADLVWIGNWGDDERVGELREFLIEPVRSLGLRATAYGVRYPDDAVREMAAAGIAYRGWLPNHDVPDVFARHRLTIHVPRRPYVRALPGIPTIRPFEALACGIPLVSALWDDVEGLFHPGRDYLVAQTGPEMTRRIAHLLARPQEAQSMAAHGLRTIHARHTCAHRVDELLAIHAELVEQPQAEVRA